jgi:hypothetical protein
LFLFPNRPVFQQLQALLGPSNLFGVCSAGAEKNDLAFLLMMENTTEDLMAGVLLGD